jgi:pullulanase
MTSAASAPVSVAPSLSALATIDIFRRKQRSFVLWQPSAPAQSPTLIIGQFQAGNPPSLIHQNRVDMIPTGLPGLWEVAATDCGLSEGEVYHYWFEVRDTHPDRQPGRMVRCTDPLAYSVDWRLLSPRLPAPYKVEDRQPAAVVKYDHAMLIPCGPGGEVEDFGEDPPPSVLPTNNQLVIYELPTAWARRRGDDETERGVGTFQDVAALVDPATAGANFDDLEVTGQGRRYLQDLGINALELLPPSDSIQDRQWGYGTSHYLAPDFELGFPLGNSWPTCLYDLSQLVVTCHNARMRISMDAVMAFSRNEAYQYADFDAFYINSPEHERSSPDAWTSERAGGQKELRQDWGGKLFRFAKAMTCYDPISGQVAQVYPARCLMQLYLARWIRGLRFDGVRVDSVESVANWDFLREFTQAGHQFMQQRFNTQNGGTSADGHYITVGEELSMPPELIEQNRLDGIWNDRFRERVRAAIMGQPQGPAQFGNAVREMIDCRLLNLGITRGTQAINYITSHDVEGKPGERERLFNMLLRQNMGDEQMAKRAKLAFVCLLTAVGIPMIFAGEEFLDEHDLFDCNGNVSNKGGKQVDPVNFGRMADPGAFRYAMRNDVLGYVSRLIHLRTTHPGLATDDVDFMHSDIDPATGKRVIAWCRGKPDNPVVVVANFSDWYTPPAPGAEYRVQNWPDMGMRLWKEQTQGRLVPPEWAGREPIYPWEAKVYTLQ